MSAKLSTRLGQAIENAGFAGARFLCERMSLDTGPAVMARTARFIGPLTPLKTRAARNLALAMPGLEPAQRDEILAGMFDHFTRIAIEYLHLPQLIAEEERITISGAAHLRTAHEAGRGVVLVTGHCGSWEAARIACARLGMPPALIYRAFNNAYVDAEGRRAMSAIDAPIFHRGRKGTLGLLRHIRGGGVAMILTDQRFTGAPDIPFFARPAPTALAAAEIAQQYGAALVPIHGKRQGPTTAFDVTIEPPITVGAGQEGAIAAMTEVNLRLESWIRENPEQYFWFHNRWGKAAAKAGPDAPDQPDSS